MEYKINNDVYSPDQERGIKRPVKKPKFSPVYFIDGIEKYIKLSRIEKTFGESSKTIRR